MPKASKAISTLFHVPERFVRSVQLERDFQDPAALEDYIVTPAMAEAFARLREGLRPDAGRRAWRITGDYGVGKSSFALVVAHLLSCNHSARLDRIAEDLGWSSSCVEKQPMWPLLLTGSRRSMIAGLAEAIAAAVGARRPARGRVPRAHAALLEKAAVVMRSNELVDLEVLLKHFRDLAADAGAGVLLVVDELGKFLEYAAQSDGGEDVYVLQRLAEMAARSGRYPFLVLGLLHQGFHAYADRLPMTARNEWEKVAGRFEEIVFDQPLAHMAALVAGALRVDPAQLPATVRNAAADVAEATAQTGWLGGGTVGAAGLDVARLYPIHPTVLPVLVRFFARFGQHERSLFGFLLSNEPFGLQQFAKRALAPNSWYRLDDLYDYVRACFGHRLAGASYRSYWLRIVATIDAAIDISEVELRLLKAIAVLNLIDADDLIPSDRALGACFSPDHQTDLPCSLAALVDRGLLFRRGAAGGYRLWPNASVNLESALIAADRALGPVKSVSAMLIPHLSAEPIMARRHYLERGTLRYFEVRYCEAGELLASSAKPSDADGVLLIVLADDEASRAAAVSLASRPPTADRSELVVSFPPPVAGLVAELADLRLWNWIAQNTTELAEDAYAMAEVSRQVSLARRTLLGRFQSLVGWRRLGSVGLCYWQGQLLEDRHTARGTSGLMSQICDELYPEAPRIANELLNRNLLSSAAAAARMRLIERMFDAAELEDLGLPASKAPPEKSIYLSVLKAGYVHVESDTGFALTLPDHKDPLRLRPALDAILAMIAGGDGDRVAVTDLFAILRSPPFGVRDGVSPLLLAVILRTHGHELAVYEHGTFLHRFGPSDFQRLIKGPQNFEIQHCQVAGVRLEVFDALLRSFADGQRSRRIDLLDVVKPLCQFAATLPDYTKRSTGLSPNARQVRDVLLSAREPLALLFSDLPVACGHEPLRAHEDDGGRSGRQFVERLQEAIDELRHTYDALLERIQRRTGEALNQQAFDRVALAARAARVSLVAREPRLRTFALRLRDPGLSDKAWSEALGSYLVSKPPSKWLAADEARFSEEAGLLAEHFCKTEAAAFDHPDMPAEIDAMRLNITRGDGQDLVRVIGGGLDEDLVREADLLSGRLPRDAALRLRLLSELLWRELSVEPHSDKASLPSGERRERAS